MLPGSPFPLGSTSRPDGVNFALAAPGAERVDLCLFDVSGTVEQQRMPLPARTGEIWHGHLEDAGAGLIYGFRVIGPHSPAEGLRFRPAKVLLDPYAREIVGRYSGESIFQDDRDNAASALKSRVVAPFAFAANDPGTCGIQASERLIYEAHVRGLTRQHPKVPEPLRGTYAGFAHPAVLDHLQSLGVTTLSLLPVQHRADEERLQKMGLSNYWGYSTIGWFAPEARYWSGTPGTTPASEFRAMADAIHARGMELIIDVVYNHSAETDEFGPTLSLRGIDNAMYYRLLPEDKSRYENWTGCGNCLNFTEPRVVQLVMDSLRYWVTELGVDGFRFDLAPVLARTGGPGASDFDPRSPFLVAAAQDPVLANALFIAEPWDIGAGGHRLGQFPTGWLEWNDKYRDAQRGFWLHRSVNRGEFAHRLLASSNEFRHSNRAPTASVNFITAHDGFTLRDLLSYNERHNLANGEDNRDGSSHNLSHNFGVEGETDDPQVLAKRRQMQRTLLAVLLLSQGTPMLLAGDELGNTQDGNNNAYCQDNETTWLDWAAADRELIAYVARLAALRREAEPLRNGDWWPGEARDGERAVRWFDADGRAMSTDDWQSNDRHSMAIVFEGDEGDPRAEAAADWLLLVNADTDTVRFTLPPGEWQGRLASDAAHDTPEALLSQLDTLSPGSLKLARHLHTPVLR